jgi:hypothetical protein
VVQAVLDGVVYEDRSVRIVEETTVWIGPPANPPDPPSERCLADLRVALAPLRGQVHQVVWFWVQFGDGPPHLGLAIQPDDPQLRRRVGAAVEPVWGRHRPDNPFISILSWAECALGIAVPGRPL